jgi:hypothetical protein
MTAFDRAWSLLKMPLFHGTSRSRWEQMQRDGYLNPTDEAPDVHNYAYEDLESLLGGFDEVERLIDGDWSFAYGDKAPMTRWSIGGRTGGIVNASEYREGEDAPVLEILDEEAHIAEPLGYREELDQRRSRYPIPVSRIRPLSEDEVKDAYLANLAHRQQAKWLHDTIMDLHLDQSLKPGWDKERMKQLDRFRDSTFITKPEQRISGEVIHPYWSGPQ